MTRSHQHVARRNRLRQWVREQKQWEAHGQEPQERDLSYRHKPKYIATLRTVIQNAKPGNSHYLIFPTQATEPNPPAGLMRPASASPLVPGERGMKDCTRPPAPPSSTIPVASQKDETMAVHAGLEQNGINKPRCLIAGGRPPGPLP